MAFEKENQKRYKENNNEIEIMYDPFFELDQTEKSIVSKNMPIYMKNINTM